MAAMAGQRPVGLLNQRGLADAGVARDQDQFGLPYRDAIEGLQQPGDLGLSTVQPLGDGEPIAEVLLGQGEGFDSAGRVQPLGRAGQVRLDAFGALVAIVGAFGHQSENQIREQERHPRVADGGRNRSLGHVSVDQLQRVGRFERQPPGEHFVEGDAERVEIAAVIEIAIHPPGLLGRHVRERAFDQVGKAGSVLLGPGPRGNAEIAQRHPAAPAVHDDVVTVDVLVDQAGAMDRGEGPGELPPVAEKGRRVERRFGADDLEGDVTGIFEDNGEAVTETLELDRPGHPGRIETLEDLEFAAKTGGIGGRGELVGQGLDDDARIVGYSARPIDRALSPVVQLGFDPESWQTQGHLRSWRSSEARSIARELVPVHRPTNSSHRLHRLASD